MPQSKQRHAIYVTLKRKHSDWSAETIRKEVDRLERSQTESHVHNPKGSHDGSHIGSQVHKQGSHKGFTGSHNGSQAVAKERYLLSYSRNKYQFVLYFLNSDGTKSLVRSCKKNDILNLGSCEIQLTWGPEEIRKEAE